MNESFLLYDLLELVDYFDNYFLMEICSECDDLTNISSEDKKFLDNRVSHLIGELRCFIKREFPELKGIRISRKLRNHLTLRVDYIQQLYRLCGATHQRYKSEYLNGTDWFIKIILDINKASFKSFLINDETASYNNLNKRDWIRLQYAILCEISQYNSNFNFDKLPPGHYHNLVKNARELSERSSEFAKDYFKPFMKSWKADFREANNQEWQKVIRENGKIYVSHQKSRNKVKIIFNF